MTHLPNTSEQDEVWIAGERKIGEISKSFRPPFGRDDSRADIAAQDLRNLHVEKMRSM